MTASPGGHQHLYRGLLRLYPADFRARFSDQMVQLFGDQVRDEGRVRSWLKAMGDIPGSALSEHLRRNRTMAHSLTLAPSPASRILGLLGVIGGALLIAAFAIQIAPDVNWLRLVLFNVGAIAVALGAYRVQASVSPRFAMSATLLVVVANTLYLLTVSGEAAHLDMPRLGMIYTVLGGAMWLSDLYFGIVSLRLGVLNRLASTALIIGAFFAFIGMGIFGLTVEGTLLNTVIMFGFAMQGVAWILLGLEIALKRRPAPPAATA